MKKLFGWLFRLLKRPIVWTALGIVLLLLVLRLVAKNSGAEELDDVLYVAGIPLATFYLAYWLNRYTKPWRLSRGLNKEAQSQAAQAGAERQQMEARLAVEINQAFKQLDTACRERDLMGGAVELPWILVLGPREAGKSTSLEKSGLRFVNLGRGVSGIGGTRHGSWWLSEEAVLLDLSGRSLLQEEDRDEWRAILRVLAKQRRHHPIDGMVLEVSVDALADQQTESLDRLALLLRERVDEIQRTLHTSMPITLVFTKCDAIEGFLEFFGSLPISERELAWGFNLDAATLDYRPLQADFMLKFDDLIERLSPRATSRALELTTPDARLAVLGFSREFRRLRDPLARFTETLFAQAGGRQRPRLTAVCFCSAMPKGSRIVPARLRIDRQFSMRAETVGANRVAYDGSPIFLRGIFQQVIASAQDAARPTLESLSQQRHLQRRVVGGTVLACFAVTLGLGAWYRSAWDWLQEVRAQSELPMILPSEPIPFENPDALTEELQRDEALINLYHGTPFIVRATRPLLGKLIRKRVDLQFVAPLKDIVTRDLQAANDIPRDSHRADDSRMLEHTGLSLRALRLAHILQEGRCLPPPPAGTPERTASGEKLAEQEDLFERGELRQQMMEDIVELWRRALITQLGQKPQEVSVQWVPDEQEDTDTIPARLKRVLGFYAEQTMAGFDELRKRHRDSDLRSPPTFSRSQLVREYSVENASIGARNALSGKSLVPLITLMLDQKLTQREPLLEQGRLTIDPIESAFTNTGCSKLAEATNGRAIQWLQCLLAPQKNTSSQGWAELEQTYREQYRFAWQRTERSLKFTLTPAPETITSLDSLQKITDEIAALVDEQNPALDSVFYVLGREQRRIPRRSAYTSYKLINSGVNWTKNLLQKARRHEPPALCTKSRLGFIGFSMALPEMAEEFEEPELTKDAKQIQAAYLTYQKDARALVRKLRHLIANENPYLDLLAFYVSYVAGNGELAKLQVSREELLSALAKRTSSMDIHEGGLGRALRSIDDTIELYLARYLVMKRGEDWQEKIASQKDSVWMPPTRIGDTNEHKKPASQASEINRCKEVISFVKEKVAPFIQEKISPFYEGKSLAHCEKDNEGTHGSALLRVKPTVCNQLVRLQEVLNYKCDLLLGHAQDLPLRIPAHAWVERPVTLKEPSCKHDAELVRIDRGEDVWDCPLNLGTDCFRSPDQPAAKLQMYPSASITIRWPCARRSGCTDSTNIATGERYEDLFTFATRLSDGRLMFPINDVSVGGSCAVGYQLKLLLRPLKDPHIRAEDSPWRKRELLPDSLR